MRHLSCLLMLCTLLSGCDQLLPNSFALQKRVGDLEQQSSKLEREAEALRAEVNDLKQKREWDDLFKNFDGIAFLKPSQDGYSVVKFDLGALTVQLTDVKPYANGAKVALRFGNPLSSAIDGLKLKVEWGRVDANGIADNASAKSKEMTFADTLRAGAWTAIPVVLDGIPASDLGFVRISGISHTGIRLVK